MKRLVGITFSIAGIILSVFVINLLMYSFVPSYHDALEAAVEGNSDIPTVTVDEAGNVMIQERPAKVPGALAVIDIEDEDDEEVPLSSTIEKDKTKKEDAKQPQK